MSDDRALIKDFVRVQWKAKIRLLKTGGMKLGKRKDRLAKIEKDTDEMFAEFQKLDPTEQMLERVEIQKVIDTFREYFASQEEAK